MPAPIVSIQELVPLLPVRGSLCGLDLGTKTIGIAVTDADRRVATPLKTLVRTKFTQEAQQFLALAAERKMSAAPAARK